MNYPVYDASTDAFGRLRVSNPVTLLDNSHIYGISTPKMVSTTSGGSSAVAYDSDEASVDITAGTGATDKAVYQSRQYIPYFPGKSQLVEITGHFDTGKANVKQRLGQFDDNNGVFFQESNGTYSVVIRSNTSGSVVENEIVQDDWEINRLSNLDLTKAQVFCIDYQWLAVGRVRFFFSIGGNLVYVHEENHSGIVTAPYMRSASLPVRYEVVNSDTAASTTTMRAICFSVMSEGGSEPKGNVFCAGYAGTVRSGVTTTLTPVLAIRNLATFNSLENRKRVKFLNLSTYAGSNGAYFEIVQATDPTTVTGNFNDVLTGISGVEISTDVTVVSGGTQIPFGADYNPSGSGQFNSSGSLGTLGVNSDHDTIALDIDGTVDQLLVVFARSLSSTVDFGCAVQWSEID